MSNKGQTWKEFEPRLSVYEHLPTAVFMKGKELPPFSRVVEHTHDWDQLVYALEGVLEVRSNEGNYIIPTQQAVWIPANSQHSISTINGAQLRSVHLEKSLVKNFGQHIRVLKVNSLVREIINKASSFEFNADMDEQQQRLLQVLADQINLLDIVALGLPLSTDPLILPILNWQQADPSSSKSLDEWSKELGASSKTISRRFNTKLGMSYSHWRERLKLHNAIHWLNEKRPVTQIALDLGYESLPAFIHMFKRNMGVTPGKFNDY
ncbi:MAG: AraC-like DNA-binding protein/quercetin dioxygenase-like cupin family protein [Enterobacterales bacterium]|jgi:AraC-like DNA-binding protein/quercetin dioxygenase-like cupin family protein